MQRHSRHIGALVEKRTTVAVEAADTANLDPAVFAGHKARQIKMGVMNEIRNICVYCGSSTGDDPIFAEAAEELGAILAESGIGLVFGGGSCGLMGALARSTLAHGGEVTGIIPDFLDEREIALPEVTDLQIVPDMHTRKRLMFEKADAFVALPGGIGTLEELTEQLTWIQLGRHSKPLVIADIGNFWRPLLSLFAHMHNAGFIRPGYEVRYMVAERINDVVPMIRTAALHAREKAEAAARIVEKF
jgi:uncharacterized protein (TIGR00730 family)